MQANAFPPLAAAGILIGVIGVPDELAAFYGVGRNRRRWKFLQGDSVDSA
jgi:hypothetical protein